MQDRKRLILELLSTVPGSEAYKAALQAAQTAGMTYTEYIRAHAQFTVGGIDAVAKLFEDDSSSNGVSANDVAEDSSNKRPTGKLKAVTTLVTTTVLGFVGFVYRIGVAAEAWRVIKQWFGFA